MKKRILITGANGFLGSRLSEYFRKIDGYETLGVSHRELEVSDSLAVSAFIKAIRPDYVLHCAGVSNTATCEKEPERSEQINVRGTSNMAKACRQSGSRMVFMSSDQIYNASDSMEPNREEGPHRPCSVYGRDKKRAEEAMLTCLHDAVALRLTWMYDYPSSDRPGGCGLLGSLLDARRENRVLKLPVHDYRGITYVWEVIRNMEAAMRLPGGVYNFGSQNSRSTFDTAALFLKAVTGSSDVSGLIERDTERFASCPRNLMIDTERIRRQGI
ncbi:SDR family oxidoreductase, partial [Enterocloster hominis (ex Hitch et al. 2024)]